MLVQSGKYMVLLYSSTQTILKSSVYTFCNDLWVSFVLKVFYFVLQTCMRDMGISDDDINGKNCGQTSVTITVFE